MGVVDCEYILIDRCGIRFRFQFSQWPPSLPDRKRMAQLSAEMWGTFALRRCRFLRMTAEI
jgi:hypothetical protein